MSEVVGATVWGLGFGALVGHVVTRSMWQFVVALAWKWCVFF